jgi:hypothetical protein
MKKWEKNSSPQLLGILALVLVNPLEAAFVSNNEVQLKTCADISMNGGNSSYWYVMLIPQSLSSILIAYFRFFNFDFEIQER